MKKHTINKRSSANPSGLLLNANQIAEALVEIGTRNRPFRVSGKFLFLTYPKCPILPEQALQLLAGVFERTNPINKFLIVKENHNDGSKHLHAWVQLSNRYDIKNPSFLYLKDQCGVEYKGNFQTMRKPLAVLEYLRKGLRDIQKESLFQLQKEEQKELYVTNLNLNALGFLVDPFENSLLLAEEGNLTKALQNLRENSPQAYLTNLHKWKSTLQEHVPKTETPAPFTCKDFIYPPALLKWFQEDSQFFSLYLSGKSNIGKTQATFTWLKEAEMEPRIIRHLEDLKTVDWSCCKAVIFDDLCFLKKTFSQKINILDVMQDSSIRVLYGVARVPAGVLKIFTSNETFKDNLLQKADYEKEYNADQTQALLRRATIIHMEDSFFKNPQKITKTPPKPSIIEKGVAHEDVTYKTFTKTFTTLTGADLFSAGNTTAHLGGFKTQNLNE